MRVRIEREHSPEYVAVFSISMSVWPVQRYTVYMNWNGLIAAYTTRYVGRGPVQTCPPLQQHSKHSAVDTICHNTQLFWPAQSFTGTDLWFPPLYIVSAASKVANYYTNEAFITQIDNLENSQKLQVAFYFYSSILGWKLLAWTLKRLNVRAQYKLRQRSNRG